MLSRGVSNSTSVPDTLHACHVSTMGAAVEGSICLYTMPNDPATAVLTGRSKGRDGAFKAVEHVCLTSHEHLEGLIVLIVTHFASCHAQHSFL